MGQPATAELIAEFLLRYHREPMRYRGQARQATHLFGNLDTVLRLALGRKVALAAPTLRSPTVGAELRRAAVFYIQQQFFREDATHYEVLGLASDASAVAVRENFRLLMQLIHPDRNAASTVWPEDLAARANRAHAVLKGPQTRAAYDRELATVRARNAAARSSATLAGSSASADSHRGLARRRRNPLYAPVLPEWMTARVGGFAWRHPAVTVFSGLIAASILVIGASVWLETDTLPAGEPSYAPVPTSNNVLAASPGRIAANAAGLPVEPEPVAIAATAVAASSLFDERSTVAALSSPPGPTEVAALLATFVSSYENGQLDAFASLFDADAQTNLYRGREAIRSEYDRLFEATAWRRMSIAGLRLQSVGDRTEATGELTVNIGWYDGRTVEQRGALDMEFARRGDTTMIVRFAYARL